MSIFKGVPTSAQMIEELEKASAKANNRSSDMFVPDESDVALFYASTLKQLIDSASLCRTFYSNKTADVVLVTDVTDFSALLPKLEALHIFRHIYCMDVNTPIAAYLFNVQAHIKDTIDLDDLIGRHGLNNDYTQIYGYYSAVSASLQYYLFLHGCFPLLHVMDDGIASYVLEYDRRMKLYSNLLAFGRKGAYIKDALSVIKKSFCEAFVMEPSFFYKKDCPAPVRSSAIFSNNADMPAILKALFGEIELPKQRYIFLEQSRVGSGPGYVSDDFYLIKKIADTVGIENIAVKLHPRTLFDRFTPAGFTVIENGGWPWEMASYQDGFYNKALITVSSTAALAGVFGSGKPQYILILSELVRVTKSKEVWPAELKGSIWGMCNAEGKYLFAPTDVQGLTDSLHYIDGMLNLKEKENV